MSSEPVLIVLVASTLAAAVSAFGALPFASERSRPRLVGAAEALASGLMLGAGYLLVANGLDRGELSALVGAAIGVVYTYLVQTYAGTIGLEPEDALSGQGYRFLLQGALHSASEGVAIGVAMLVEIRLGLFLAAALALHNIAEGVALSGLLRRNGMGTGEAAGLCVVTKLTQPLLALAVFALAPLLAARLAVPLGFAAGALLFLVLTELLPDSYPRIHKAVIASLVTLAAGAVVLIEDILL